MVITRDSTATNWGMMLRPLKTNWGPVVWPSACFRRALSTSQDSRIVPWQAFMMIVLIVSECNLTHTPIKSSSTHAAPAVTLYQFVKRFGHKALLTKMRLCAPSRRDTDCMSARCPCWKTRCWTQFLIMINCICSNNEQDDRHCCNTKGHH